MDASKVDAQDLRAEVERYPWYHTLDLGNGVRTPGMFDHAPVLDRYPLRQDERRAIETRNFLALYDIGLHPYLGGQLARLIFGNEAGKGATVAVNKLVESLQGKGPVA